MQIIPVLDSVNPHGQRLLTVELREFPKFALAQLNTHGQLARNAASSRAIPLAKFRENATYSPDVWWRNSKGMSPSEAITDQKQINDCFSAWDDAREESCEMHRELEQYGVHKQQANRLLEPFATVSVLVSATEWDNFLNQRIDHNAQDVLQEVAQGVGKILVEHQPTALDWGQLHTPYNTTDSWLASAGRCARVSYNQHDGTHSVEKDEALATKLMGDGHMSPFEHPAMAVPGSHGRYNGWCAYRRFVQDPLKPVEPLWKSKLRR